MEHLPLIAADLDKTVNFFYIGLKTELGEEKINDLDMQHVAKALGHMAMTSRFSGTGIPFPANLSEVHDMFVLNESWINDASAQVTAGAAIFLFAGFLRSKEGGRYNWRFFEQLGEKFYSRASELTRSEGNRRMYKRLAEEYSEVTDALYNFHLSLRLKRYLIVLKNPN